MRKFAFYLVIFSPIILFIFGFVLQYNFGFIPCNLCIVERWIFLLLFAALLQYKKRWIFALTAAAGLAVSLYHKMVQIGIFTQCHFFGNYNTVEEFANAVENAVPCSARTVIMGVDSVWFNIVFFALYFSLAAKKPKWFFRNDAFL